MSFEKKIPSDDTLKNGLADIADAIKLDQNLQNTISTHTSSIATNTANINKNTAEIESLKASVNTGTFDPMSDNPAGQKSIAERTIDLSKVVDSKGHPRFIEGTGTKSSTDTGLTVTYNRWSLSGTHFMWVIAGTLAKDSVIGGQNAPDHNMNFVCYLPNWVYNKIIAVFGSRYIAFYAVKFVADDWSVQTEDFLFSKYGTSLIFSIPFGASDITINKERHFRIQVDLLIDNA